MTFWEMAWNSEKTSIKQYRTTQHHLIITSDVNVIETKFKQLWKSLPLALKWDKKPNFAFWGIWRVLKIASHLISNTADLLFPPSNHDDFTLVDFNPRFIWHWYPYTCTAPFSYRKPCTTVVFCGNILNLNEKHLKIQKQHSDSVRKTYIGECVSNRNENRSLWKKRVKKTLLISKCLKIG